MSCSKMKDTTDILKGIRRLMKDITVVPEPLSAYIVPTDDEHQSEYVASCDERRAYISGFTGSAGTAVVTDDKAALWTDGRYFLQASKQLDSNWSLMKEGVAGTPTIGEWLNNVLGEQQKVGVDPNVYSTLMWSKLSQELGDGGNMLLSVKPNLVDLVWQDRPSAPPNCVRPLGLEYHGEVHSVKIKRVRQKMSKKKVDAVILSALDDVAWLFNLRGSRILFNPVFKAFAAVTMDTASLFIDPSDVTPAVSDHLRSSEPEVRVVVQDYSSICDYILKCVEALPGKIWISRRSSHALGALVPPSKRYDAISPVQEMKAVKNDVELKGMRACQIRDGVAVIRYLSWLDRNIGSMVVTEMSGATKLEELRSCMDLYVGLSFETISSSGPNGAVIHYSPSADSDRRITDREMYLVDSGGQYLDGTTDTTRTVHFGCPTLFQKDCYTRVLKGQIALGSVSFPEGLEGNRLDSLARQFLWQKGLDYKHGTGHGVGSYLNVHEGPSGITWKAMPDDPGIQEGMVFSNEPGYYKDGDFGIRLENMMIAVPSASRAPEDKKFLTFETITMVPLQTSLIECDLLTPEEVSCINNYHVTVRNSVGPLLRSLDAEAFDWMIDQTAPIG